MGRLDVAVAGACGRVVFEKDDAADVVVADVAHYGAFVVDGGATKAYEKHLANVIKQLRGGRGRGGDVVGGIGYVLAAGGEAAECYEEGDEFVESHRSFVCFELFV